MAVDANQTLHLVDRQSPAAQRVRHLAATRLERGKEARCCFLAVFGGDGARASDQRLLDIGEQLVRFLDKACAFLEAAARAVEHRFDLDEASGEILFRHPGVRSPRPASLSRLSRGYVAVRGRWCEDL